VKLLLDEMISPRVARELRERGHDVQAVKERPDLVGRGDRELVRQMVAERRATVTNDVADFQAIHDRLLAAGEEHYGMVFTFDATLPRSKDTLSQWVRTLSELLATHGTEDALRNRVYHLP
jgi:predicted nuclease of predicted toxin-antitoxin system